MRALENYRADIVDIDGDSLVFEVIGNSQTIDEVLTKMESYGLATVSRTGIAAGFKGAKRLDRLDSADQFCHSSEADNQTRIATGLLRVNYDDEKTRSQRS